MDVYLESQYDVLSKDSSWRGPIGKDIGYELHDDKVAMEKIVDVIRKMREICANCEHNKNNTGR